MDTRAVARSRPVSSAFFFTTEGHYAGSTNASLASHSAHDVLRLSVFDPVEEIWARLNAFQPQRLHSFASALTWLAEWTLQGKLRIAPRSVLVTGDRLSPAMRALVKEVWDADIYDLYATSESLYMAVRRPTDEEFQVFTDVVLLEVVDRHNKMVQPGTRGRVLLTNLFHAPLPFIRYDLHDYAIPGKVGLGAETLLALDGKADEALPVRLVDGNLGALEIYEMAQLDLPGVEKIQFVSHSPIEVEIRYQSQFDLDAQIEAIFRRLLAQKSAAVEKVTVRRVERVLNDWRTYKLRRVVEPDQEMLTLKFLGTDDGCSSARAPAREEVAASQPPELPHPPGGKDDRVWLRVLASRAIVGTNLALSNLSALTNGVTDHLRVTLSFPSGRTADELCPTEPASLVWAAQMGALTFHPWPVRRAECTAETTPVGNGPQQFRSAYGLPGSGGHGRTVAIVDAFVKKVAQNGPSGAWLTSVVITPPKMPNSTA